jgi:hypothetical protein
MNVPLLLDARWLERVYLPLPSNVLINPLQYKTASFDDMDRNNDGRIGSSGGFWQ